MVVSLFCMPECSATQQKSFLHNFITKWNMIAVKSLITVLLCFADDHATISYAN